MASKYQQILDTSWFTTLEEAMPQLRPVGRYDNLAAWAFGPSGINELDIESLVLQSLLVRVHGLHLGVLNGLESNNPHAVWPLLRSLFELEISILYLSRHPLLIASLAEHRRDTASKKKMLPRITKMLEELKTEIPAGADAYNELSSLTHVEVLATWSSHLVNKLDGEIALAWSPEPRFRPEQLPIAVTQLIELVEGCSYGFRELVISWRATNASL